MTAEASRGPERPAPTIPNSGHDGNDRGSRAATGRVPAALPGVDHLVQQHRGAARHQRQRADPRTHPGLELGLVCLRVTGTGSPADDDAATRALLASVNASGRALLSHTEVDGRFAVRVAFGSIGTTDRHVEELWELLARVRT